MRDFSFKFFLIVNETTRMNVTKMVEPWTSAPKSQWKLIIIKAFILRALHCLYSANGVYRGVVCVLPQTQMKHFTNLCMCINHENNNWAQRTTGRRGGWDCASRSRGPSRFVPEHSRFTLFLFATKIAKSRAGKGRQLNVKIERVNLSQLAFYISELEGNFTAVMFCIKCA